MLKKILYIVAMLLFASTRYSYAGNDRLVLTGSSTVAPLATEIARSFEKQNPGIRIDVQTGGSSRGIMDARKGIADIGMVSRRLKPSEGDLTAYPIALDGIGIIINRENTVQKLNDTQIIAIYTGVIENWKDVGGPDMPISVVNKAEGRSTLDLFLEHFGLKNSEIKADVIIGDNQQGIKTVSGVAGAIGYVSIGTAEFEEQRGTPVRLLEMSGVPASVNNVQNGSYPLSRQLNFVARGKPLPLAQRFIDYAQSRKVHDLVRSQFFVPLEH